jgi:hypothetical protein
MRHEILHGYMHTWENCTLGVRVRITNIQGRTLQALIDIGNLYTPWKRVLAVQVVVA